MKIIKLYCYERDGGGVTVSPVEPDVPYTEMYRLVADDGMELTNGEITSSCVDTETIEGWEEVPALEEVEDGTALNS